VPLGRERPNLIADARIIGKIKLPDDTNPRHSRF